MHNAIKNTEKVLAGIAAFATISAANATCWEAASKDYGIPVDVLKAVAKTESGFNASARNKNTNGSTDIGLMQINSVWLPKLKSYGIDEVALTDACTNLKVGAWILSGNAKSLGWNWSAIGAYNVGCRGLKADECQRRRNSYAWKIYNSLHKVAELDSRTSPSRLSEKAVLVAAANPRKTIVVTFNDTSDMFQSKDEVTQIAEVRDVN